MKTHCPIHTRFLLLLALCLNMALPLCADDFLFTTIDASQGLSDNQVRYILQLPDGRMAFTTTESINLYDGAHFTSLPPDPNSVYPLKQYKGFYHIYLSGDSLLWIKDYQRLMCINLHNEQYITDLDSLFRSRGIQEPVEDLFADYQGHVWTITSGEIMQRELSFRMALPDKQGNIQDLMADKDFLYLFYNTGRIACYRISTGEQLYDIAAYPEAEQEKFQNTSLILKGKDGFYQLRNGSKGGFFFFDFHKRAWSKILEKDYTLNTLMISPDNKAYISCVRGFWIIDLIERTQQYLPVLRTRKGNIVATEISTIFQDRQGALWLGMLNRGLLYYHPSMYKRIHIDRKDFPISIKENTVTSSFAEDRNGRIFIKDQSAIYRLDMQADSSRRLVPIEASAFPKELQGEYGSGAAFVSHDGTLYFGGNDGCDIFCHHPESLSVGLPYPPVLTAFYIHGERAALPQAAPYTRRISLNHNQNFITFECSALNYFNRNHTHYRYQLEGIDKQWVHVFGNKQNNGILQAPYTNLPPGHYTFKVIASGDANHWNDGEMTRIELTIHAPWWKTRIAYAAYLLLASITIAASIRLYMHRTQKELERLHKEEILLLRIRNLIEQCNRYEAERNKDAKEQNLHGENEASADGNKQDSAESAFLTRAIELVEKNLHVPGYSVEQLSRDLCMERTGLYRKLVGMLDQSPSLFIRNIRLQRAAQLILEGNLSITEIAECTGFSSSSYLSKCFQEMYGCRPSEYAEKTKEST